jgi:hypothetical protein
VRIRRHRKPLPPPVPGTRVEDPTLGVPGSPYVAPEVPDGTLEDEIGRVSALLSLLHRDYGVLYGSRTWVQDVLPALGVAMDEPQLVRDVVAVAALGAGGVRAEVGSLAESYDDEQVRAVAIAVRRALDTYADTMFAGEALVGVPLPDADLWVRAA